jgi:dethiobiotin synthetase
MLKRFFVSGIGTEVGKTLVSAILCEAWKTDYWKPVQSGGLDHTDCMEVKALVSNQNTKFHPETYLLPFPISPHASAARAGVDIDTSRFNLPETSNNLIVEGAGGLMVPLNHRFFVIDLIAQLRLPVILVSRHYLGSINHTLLSIDLLRTRGVELAGIVFNGAQNSATEEVILQYSFGLKVLGRIPHAEKVDRAFVLEQAGCIGQMP